MLKRQFVFDTNVLVAGLRSRRGASFRLLQMLAHNQILLNVSVALALEYEAVRKRPGLITGFYPSASARHDFALPGSLRLLASEKRRAALEQYCRRMHVMIVGEPPEFGHTIETLASLETKINERHRG